MTADQRKRLAREARRLAYARAAKPGPSMEGTYSELERSVTDVDACAAFNDVMGFGVSLAGQQANPVDATIFPLLAFADALESA